VRLQTLKGAKEQKFKGAVPTAIGTRKSAFYSLPMKFTFPKCWLVVLLCTASAISASAQTVTTLVSFERNASNSPLASLVQGLDGNFYGTTWSDYCGACATVFRVTPSGNLTTLYKFQVPGSRPWATLVLATGGGLYGTTENGGKYGDGETFKISTSGTFKKLYSFCAKTDCSDGSHSTAALVQATSGSFYGTTAYGGTNCIPANGCGTVFRMSPSGTLATLYNFCAQSNCADGETPSSGLVQAADGSLYGETFGGGIHLGGTLFRITSSGALTTVYAFCAQSDCADGHGPNGGLVQGADGSFFGTTVDGGMQGKGTVFKITRRGLLTTLYSFCAQSSCADGSNPYGSLVQGSDGNFYGTTAQGGTANNGGTVFRVTPGGSFTQLYAFCAPNDCSGEGVNPKDGLVQGTDGSFYGTTPSGGAEGVGVVFELSVGLGAFVEALPYAAKAAKTIKILGQGMTGTTTVSFNGTSASFSVKSDTYLTATVPAGATTGFVTVTTPSGPLKSNKQFRVLP
jgi:uncharacterized repeat protein (TIGR03803 family)